MHRMPGALERDAADYAALADHVATSANHAYTQLRGPLWSALGALGFTGGDVLVQGDGASGSAPLQWHRDFDDARHRLRRWVAACGTQSTADRPTLVAAWPGESPHDLEPARPITDRDADFQDMVRADLQERMDALDRVTDVWPAAGRSGGA